MEKWFESWFDTKYYHMLYGNRNDSDARIFLDNLCESRNYSKNDSILDLACGKGRHAIYLNKLGFNVTGVDLSKESIVEAKKKEKEGLSFFVHDMIAPIENKSFDIVLNLFTSFGYFDSKDENLEMLNSIKTYLNWGGELVIDFFNANKVIENLVESEQKQVADINFDIKRKVEGGYIVKEINFTDKGQEYQFIEKVSAFKLKDFEQMFNEVGFVIKKIAGDYEMNEFNSDNSDRLIFCLGLK